MPIVIGDMTAYDLKEIAKVMRISLQTIRVYVKKGVLKAVKVGSKLYVQEKDLKKIFETGTHKPTRKEKRKKKTAPKPLLKKAIT